MLHSYNSGYSCSFYSDIVGLSRFGGGGNNQLAVAAVSCRRSKLQC